MSAPSAIRTDISPAQPEGVQRSPWWWVPSLYFSQGIPYVMVMTLSVVMYKRLGISNTDIALYTSWLYLPWVIKPLWSPLVDITRTKRFWIISMQFIVAVALALVAFSVPGSGFFKWSLFVFWIMAFASATHDIAADGFYMLSLSKHEQTWWVGLRSTFYRTSMIVGSGLLVVLAGVLESKNGLPPVQIPVHATHSPAPIDWRELPAPQSELNIVAAPPVLQIGITNVAAPRGTGSTGVVEITLSRRPEPNRSVVVTVDRKKAGLEYIGLAKSDKGFRLLEGERLVFDESNWNVPAKLVIQLDPRLDKNTSVVFVASSGNIPLAWSITLFVVAITFLAFTCWHAFALPHPASDGPAATRKGFFQEFLATFSSFFQKPGVLLALSFILLYRLAEAQLVKVITPFLLDERDAGGLGMTTSQVGLAYGTFGILALTFGGLVGGFLAAKYGLRRMLPVMVAAMYLPKIAFVFLSIAQPENFLVASAAVAIEQFGYGFGFTAFMLYMLYFSDGAHKTAHYAICTGFMALGMMLPGMWSGWLVDLVGYQNFYLWLLLAGVPGVIIAFLVRIDPAFGKKTA